MKILIATGIYPPDIGGPSEYAKNLGDVWRKSGHSVKIATFSRFNFLPTGLRHLVFFFYILPSVLTSDFILILDTFSAALPTVIASLIFGKETILRTGGDFLWEGYVERTNDMVLLREFYTKGENKLSQKEKITKRLISFVLRNVSAIAWTTEWQKNIFVDPYNLSDQKHAIIENYYGEKIESFPPNEKNFIAGSRPLKWKNLAMLKEIFNSEKIKSSGAVLDVSSVLHEEFLNKISHSYAVILSSIGDIGPNTILDAIRCGKPFIVTKETGLYERIKEIALFIEPMNPEDIKNKILWLMDSNNYEMHRKKVLDFNFQHSWEDIAKEYIDVYKNLK
jgi:hypothetical protein